ncbi:MAG: HlyD family secretion protein [Epsilonproteobacteria bacterium]|nr:MAG: HlyD family secretion protein [Campylobacterota bacterium]
MKKIFLIVLLSCGLYSSSVLKFYSTSKPLHKYIIKSQVSGSITYINDDIKGKFAKNSTILKIDDKVDKVRLKQLQNKLYILNKLINIEQKNYNHIKKFKFKSQLEKDAQLTKLLNLKSQKADIKPNITSLQETVSNKTLLSSSDYIYDIAVEVGEWVNMGSPLYEAHDLSKAKLTIYIPIDIAGQIKTKTIYIDDIKTAYKIDKLYKVADKKHISSYKCEIIINSPTNFSSLKKIEFK